MLFKASQASSPSLQRWAGSSICLRHSLFLPPMYQAALTQLLDEGTIGPLPALSLCKVLLSPNEGHHPYITHTVSLPSSDRGTVCVSAPYLTQGEVKRFLRVLASLHRLMLSSISHLSVRSYAWREEGNGFTIHLIYARVLASQTASVQWRFLLTPRCMGRSSSVVSASSPQEPKEDPSTPSCAPPPAPDSLLGQAQQSQPKSSAWSVTAMLICTGAGKGCGEMTGKKLSICSPGHLAKICLGCTKLELAAARTLQSLQTL